MIRLAISNIAWDPCHDIQMYHTMAELGYTGLEIAPSRLFGKVPYDCLDAAGQWAEGLREEFHMEIPSMQSIWYGRDENIFRSEKERDTLLQYTLKAMEFAKTVSCRNMVFGCPRNRNIGVCRKDAAAVSVDFFKALGRAAASRGIVMGIEANPAIYHTDYLNTTGEAASLLKECSMDGLGLNLDLGTMIYNHEPMEMAREVLPLVSHVHISEPGLAPIRERAEHRQLFEILYEEGYGHFVSIEMGRCDDLDTITGAMKYIKEICERAEC